MENPFDAIEEACIGNLKFADGGRIKIVPDDLRSGLNVPNKRFPLAGLN